MSPRPFRHHLAFLLLTALVLCAEAWILFRPTSGIRAAGRSVYGIEAFAERTPVGQTFRILDDGMDSVAVELSADRPALVEVRWQLLVPGGNSGIGSGAWDPVVAATTTLRLPRGHSVHRFGFSPIFPSEKHVYQLQVQQLAARPLDPAQPGSPIVQVVASRDDALPDGNVVIGNSQIIDRDLFFQAETASLFKTFWARASPWLPRWLRYEAVQIAMLALYNWALVVFAFQLLARVPSEDEPYRRARVLS